VHGFPRTGAGSMPYSFRIEPIRPEANQTALEKLRHSTTGQVVGRHLLLTCIVRELVNYSMNRASCGLRLKGTGSVAAWLPAGASLGPLQGATGENVPTVRLYFVSDLAGALEPCGCTKDQLGGLDHAAAWMAAEHAHAPVSALALAGPTFFMNASLAAEHKDQDVAKAETIADSLKSLGCAAFAPGENDWVDGDAELIKLRNSTGGALLVSNFDPGSDAAVASKIVTLNGVRVGFIGVGAPAGGSTLPRASAAEAVEAQVAKLKTQGANVFVALASVGRGEAKRIADLVPDLLAIVVGSPTADGEGNTETPPGERVGGVIIAETGNHLQSVGVLDLFVRGGSFVFADATGFDAARKRTELTRRVDELHVKIANWEKDGKIAKTDLDARRADLSKLEAERGQLDERPAPSSGSFFRYAVKEIRTSLGREPSVTAKLGGYYKSVNDHNRMAFANRLPPPPVVGQPSYVGVHVCAGCHGAAKVFWDTTRHASAYPTLSFQNKQFNLDCVSCHVTGYDKPGGSSVTHVANLENVQCEVCHGPGSLHAASPRVDPPNKHPKEDLCLACHHPPHVEEFDAKAKMSEILGPGHGV